MMETRFPELQQLEVTVPDEARDRQWNAIQQAIATAPRGARVPLRRRVALWVAAAFTVGLPVTAVAAEDTLPGDLLYPVKLAVEPLRSLFDSDVAAVHRVEELERIAESDVSPAEIDRALARADDAIDEVTSPELDRRVERVRQLVRNRASHDGDIVDQPRDRAPVGDESTTTTAPDRSTTTLGDPPLTSDEPPRDSDGATSTTQVRDRSTSTSGPHDSGSGDGRHGDGG